jgi:hypothetical protein
MRTHHSRFLVALAIGVLALSACRRQPSRWDHAAEAPLPAKPADPAAQERAGGSFNKAFPADGIDGYRRIFTQEKLGFAEAKLQAAGKVVATLAISDVAQDAAAKGKFDEASDTVWGFPLVTVGRNQSALLVNERFQLKVSSPTLAPDARKDLLSKFDLKALKDL